MGGVRHKFVVAMQNRRNDANRTMGRRRDHTPSSRTLFVDGKNMHISEEILRQGEWARSEVDLVCPLEGQHLSRFVWRGDF